MHAKVDHVEPGCTLINKAGSTANVWKGAAGWCITVDGMDVDSRKTRKAAVRLALKLCKATTYEETYEYGPKAWIVVKGSVSK